jgi:hypothetical protein
MFVIARLSRKIILLPLLPRAHTGEDREREALVQQARVKNKKGFRPGRSTFFHLWLETIIEY